MASSHPNIFFLNCLNNIYIYCFSYLIRKSSVWIPILNISQYHESQHHRVCKREKGRLRQIRKPKPFAELNTQLQHGRCAISRYILVFPRDRKNEISPEIIIQKRIDIYFFVNTLPQIVSTFSLFVKGIFPYFPHTYIFKTKTLK